MAFDVTEARSSVQWRLFSLNGQLLRQEQHFIPNGLTQQWMRTDDLAPSVYLLELQTEFGVSSQKFVVQ